ncbi:MAG: sn-glycerol-3-phosphate ABC transporter substrate-binding protein UgpB [Rhodospirillaceae bacterium]|nr:sn-glycerol-3-phosphate ABC transporter substrate-binding protein UgpB [Rhodospirillaceae bacterium]
MKIRLATAVAAVALFTAAPASAQIEIQWWHAMGGALGDWVQDLADDFNASQDDYVVIPTNRGNYTETMTAAVAAFRAGEQPHIVQVFEVGTATMMAAEGAVYPVYQLMEDTGQPFDPSVYLAAVTGYYTTADGQMLSLPFNSSTPVMYYNRDIFAAAGLDPDTPPATWPEVEDALRTIVDGGFAECGFTTAWQSWIQIENFSAWHNVPIGTLANGFGGLGTEFTINGPAQVHHIGWMADMMADNIFVYGGRRGDSQALFTSGQCAMFFNSSAGYAGIRESAEFDFGIGMLPYWPDYAEGPDGGPQNAIIGGASLWVLTGHTPEEYEGVARFFNYLSDAEVQAASHQRTGYLPITTAAAELTRESGFYDENPGTDVSVRQMALHAPTENSAGLRFGNFVQIRDIFNEELEAVWSGQKTAQEALDSAVERGNELLRQFEADNS